MLLSACNDREHHFRVTGVDGEFCVPDTGYVAPGVWFVPPDAPGDNEGFSFGGCHRLSNEKARGACLLPRNFVSADVFSLNEKRALEWVDLKKSADFGANIVGSGKGYIVDYDSGFLVLRVSGGMSGWSIWKTQSRPDVGELSMHDGDELMATCSAISDFPRSAGLEVKGEYGCLRYVRGLDFAIEYRFISKERIPRMGEINALDKSIFSEINRWRCSVQ